MNLNLLNRLLTGLLALLLLTSAPAWADEAQADPWGAATTTTTVEDPWGSTATEAADWQSQIAVVDNSAAVDWLDPFQQALVPLDTWVEGGIGWLVENLRPLFQLIRAHWQSAGGMAIRRPTPAIRRGSW